MVEVCEGGACQGETYGFKRAYYIKETDEV